MTWFPKHSPGWVRAGIPSRILPCLLIPLAVACDEDPLAYVHLALSEAAFLHTELSEVVFGETLIVGGDQLELTVTNPDSSQSVLEYRAQVEEGSFELVAARGSLRPGETGKITIRFTPTETGPNSAQIFLHHNALNEPDPLILPVRGSGTRSRTFEGNPLFWAADPAGHVWFDGKMWIYPTTDLEDWDELVHWNAWSSEDLKTWTVHEKIFTADECDWCVDNAWAPDIAYKEGRYYLYYYFRNSDGNPGGIGVAVGDHPQGPFTNMSLGGPLVDGHDPAVFVDDDGQGYIYAGHMVYFLSPDMISLQMEGSRPKDYPLDLRGHTPTGGWEALWVFEREGRYYLSLADEEYRQLRYYIGTSPLGPFHHAGELLEKVAGPNVHHSIVPFGDRWVLWYHLWDEGGPGQRRVYGEFLTFNEDGTIQPATISDGGVADGGFTPSPPPILHSDHTEVRFGETLILDGGELSIPLANPDSSESVLRFEAKVEDGPFELESARGSLKPGETGEILIRFTPLTTGAYSTRLSIHHNATNAPNPLVLPVSGEGSRTRTFEGNGLFWAADPAGHVWADGEMWIYPTTDFEDWDQLVHWNAWSSPDLKRWTLHEKIFHADACDWCVNNAWAPDVAFREGRYYLYYYFRNDGGNPAGIGVAVSDQPQGPFTNVSTEGPLLDGHDPAIFVDDDGQAYLYAGPWIYFLSPDMVSLQKVGGRNRDHPLYLRGHTPVAGWESIWVFKRDGRYYVSLADEDYRQLRYYIGSSPLGPFDYAGTILEKAAGPNIHHSIVPFGNQWVLWYHQWDEEGPGQRRVYREFLTFNEDGTIELESAYLSGPPADNSVIDSGGCPGLGGVGQCRPPVVPSPDIPAVGEKRDLP